ncbi:MAG: ribonuclease III [Eubacteriaceae bacterium]|nr:ribonuclease III [Eubacteriaceae bacterium]
MTIEEKIKYRFEKKEFLKIALTHSSHAGNAENNERLEFLGDAVLELIISEYLYESHKLSEGKMTKIRSNIVCAESLSKAAYDLYLGDHILLGKGEIVTGGRRRKSNLANAFEAIIGAVFLDSNFETTREMVLRLLDTNIQLALSGALVKDHKTELQEHIQKNSDNVIEYVLEKSEGPEHNKTFYIDLLLNGQCVSKGVGKSKKEGEQDAAKNYMFEVLSK